MAAADTDATSPSSAAASWARRWRCASRSAGSRVTVVERGIPGAEASSAAAGILGPQMEAEGPGPLLDLGLTSRALYPALADELRDATGIDVGYDRSGVLAAALDDAGEGELARGAPGSRRAACASAALTGERSRAREPALGPDVRAALVFPDDGAGQRARAGARVLAGGGGRGRALPHRPLRAPRGASTAARPRASSWTARRCRRATVVVAAGSWSGLVEGGGRARRPSCARRAASSCRSRPARRCSATSSPCTARLPGAAPRRHRAGGQHRRDGRLPQAGDRRRPGRDPDAGAHAGARRCPRRR